MTGLREEGLDDVRLATSEAVGRAVAAHRSHGLDDLIQIEVSLGKVLQVRVCDRVSMPEASGAEATQLLQAAAEAVESGAGASPSSPQDELDTLELKVPQFLGFDLPVLPEAVSLIEGLADESSVATGPNGTVVTMRWRRAD